MESTSSFNNVPSVRAVESSPSDGTSTQRITHYAAVSIPKFAPNGTISPGSPLVMHPSRISDSSSTDPASAVTTIKLEKRITSRDDIAKGVYSDKFTMIHDDLVTEMSDYTDILPTYPVLSETPVNYDGGMQYHSNCVKNIKSDKFAVNHYGCVKNIVECVGISKRVPETEVPPLKSDNPVPYPDKYVNNFNSDKSVLNEDDCEKEKVECVDISRTDSTTDGALIKMYRCCSNLKVLVQEETEFVGISPTDWASGEKTINSGKYKMHHGNVLKEVTKSVNTSHANPTSEYTPPKSDKMAAHHSELLKLIAESAAATSAKSASEATPIKSRNGELYICDSSSFPSLASVSRTASSANRTSVYGHSEWRDVGLHGGLPTGIETMWQTIEEENNIRRSEVQDCGDRRRSMKFWRHWGLHLGRRHSRPATSRNNGRFGRRASGALKKLRMWR